MPGNYGRINEIIVINPTEMLIKIHTNRYCFCYSIGMCHFNKCIVSLDVITDLFVILKLIFLNLYIKS